MTKVQPRKPARKRPTLLHPLFWRPPTITPDRRKELLKTIETAALELWPDSWSFIVRQTGTRPFEQLGNTETIDVERSERPDPMPGTIGELALHARMSLFRVADKLDRNRDPKRIADFTPKGWIHYRACNLAGELEFLAGAIPVAEFGPAEWAAFLAGIPQRFIQSPEMDLLVKHLAAAGLHPVVK